jgi:hypothetical protein
LSKANLPSSVVTSTGTPTAGQIPVFTGAGNQTAPSVGVSSSVLTPTAIKTAAYTAASQDLVLADVSSGGWTLTLPTAPPDKTQVGWSIVKQVAAGVALNALNVLTGGSDTFTAAGGLTSISALILNHPQGFQYDAALGAWVVLPGTIAYDAATVQSPSTPLASRAAFITRRGALGFKDNPFIDLSDYGVDFTGNSFYGSANVTAINQAIVDASARANVLGRIVPIRGSVGDTYLSGMINLANNVSLEGPMEAFYGGEGWTLENHSTDMFGYGSASYIKHPVLKNLTLFGDSTLPGSASYQTYPFDRTAYATKSLYYPTIEGVSFQYFAGMQLQLLGGEIQASQFIHMGGPVQLSGYDFRFGTKGYSYMGMDSVNLTTLSSALPAGTAVTSLPVQSIPTLKSGAFISVEDTSTGHCVSLVLSAATTASSSPGTIPVNSVTPSVTIPAGANVVGGANVSTPGILLESPNYAGSPNGHSSNVGVGDVYFTLISGGRALLARNIQGLNVKTLGCDGYNTANTAQYGQAGAAIYLQNCLDVDIDNARLHCVMGGPTQDGTTAPLDPGAITIDTCQHVSIRGSKHIYQPTGTGTIGLAGACSDITIGGSTYDTADGRAVIVNSTANPPTITGTPTPLGTTTGLRFDEIGAPGPAGPMPFTTPTVWNSGATYVAQAGSQPANAVTRNGSLYMCVLGNTNIDPSTDNGTHWMLLASGGASVVSYNGFFGDGSDGTVTLDGTTTYTAFATKSGNTYTLSRDVMLSSLTINSAITLNQSGYMIYVDGTFTNNGTITAAGGNASGATGGSSGGIASNTFVKGGTGGTGTTTVGGAGGSGGYGGNTGSAGGTSANAGGAGGGISATASTYRLKNPQAVLTGITASAGASRYIGGGGGGGAGGGDGSNSGGGGGGAGGVAAILAKTIINNGTITANGGNGANGTGGNAGGGAGGGGGLSVVFTLSSITGTGTITATAGTAGSGVGTGGSPSASNAGNVITEVLQ